MVRGNESGGKDKCMERESICCLFVSVGNTSLLLCRRWPIESPLVLVMTTESVFHSAISPRDVHLPPRPRSTLPSSS